VRLLAALALNYQSTFLGGRKIDVAQDEQDGKDPNQQTDFANLSHCNLHHRLGNKSQAEAGSDTER